MADTVLLTGSNGFIGRHIALKSPRNFSGLRLTDRGPHSDQYYQGMYRQADITQADMLEHLCRGCDVVVHAAGLAHVRKGGDASAFDSVNRLGTLNMAKAAATAGVKHFILISTVAVYGRVGADGIDEDADCRPDGPYAESKYLAEIEARRISENSGMALTVLRVATAYGNGDPGNVGRLLQAVARRRFCWVGRGQNQKSLIHCEDVARAVWAVVNRPARGVSVFNLSAPPCRMAEVVELLSLFCKKSVWPFWISGAMAQGLIQLVKHVSVLALQRVALTLGKWLADDVYSAQRFEQAYDFSPKIRLEVGLRREVAWFCRQKTRGLK